MGGGMSYGLLERDGTSWAGVMAMDPASYPAEVPPHWMIYFEVEDTDAAAAKVTDLGGSVTVPPMDTPPGRFAYVQDQHGASFAIIKSDPNFRA
jgi:predicted enzyme related to lactoylglutathione lyase